MISLGTEEMICIICSLICHIGSVYEFQKMQVDQEEQQKTEEQQQVQPENKADLEEMEVIRTSEISVSLQDTSGRFMRICSV